MVKKKLDQLGSGGRTLYGELFAEQNWKREVKKAFKQAEIMLEAKDAPAGEQTVVLDQVGLVYYS